MKRILLSIIASGACIGAMAIPAKPGFVSFTQPDGSVVKVKMAGDEHGHMMYSMDGHLLLETNGRLEYARFDALGYPVASGILVDAKGLDPSIAKQLQTQEQIELWTEKMTANRINRLELKKTAVAKVNEGEDEAGNVDSDDPNADGSDDSTDDNRLVPLNFGRCDSQFPVIGEQKAVVILVEYQDVEFKYGDHDYFWRLLNEEGFSDHGSLGSARDWFMDNSNGQFLPEFDVYGPVLLPENRSYYGKNDIFGNDEHPEDMVIHAMEILDEEVDFSQYDRDEDGVIDNVFVFYAGKGEHDSGIANTVWPHSWEVATGAHKNYEFDGVQLNHYACSCEYPSGYKRPDGIGTFVHEFSHVMGLPDLYATNYSRSFTPGSWSVLDSGPYNNDGLTPPNYSSYEKCALGWLEFLPLEEGAVEIPYLAESNIAYVLPTPKNNEFFFFENRQQEGNDQFIPGHGMLVWHVDYKKSVWDMNTVNNNQLHNYVDLVEADNVKTEVTRKADAFPGTKNVTEFGYKTKPQLVSWARKQLPLDLINISESDEGVITFDAVDSFASAADMIVDESIQEDTVVYDLMGRKIKNPGKGIFIVNGKKVVK